jgi:hypothetical protein
MTEDRRIKDEQLASQILAFDGMKYGNCRPTDIDLFIDFGGKMFVYGEAKHFPSNLTTGQRRALEEVVNNAEIPVYAIMFHHHAAREDRQIPVKDCKVYSYYTNVGGKYGSWKKNYSGKTVDQFIKWVYNKHIGQEEEETYNIKNW